MTTTNLKERIEEHGRKLLAIFPNATTKDPAELCRKLRRIEAKGAAFAMRLCNGPEFKSPEAAEEIGAAILFQANALLGNLHDSQPKTGEPCGCKRGRQRENCSTCEGTGQVIDFAAIRNRPPLVPTFLNRDPRGYALKIDEEYTALHQLAITRDWGGYGIIAPDFREGN